MGHLRREAAVSMQRATGLIKGSSNYAKHREDPEKEDGDEKPSDSVDDAVGAPGAAATPWNVAASVKARLEEELKRERSLSKRGLAEAQELGRPGAASPTGPRSRQLSTEGLTDEDFSGAPRRTRSNRPYRQRPDGTTRTGAGATGAGSRGFDWDCGWPPAPGPTATGEFDEAIYAALAALPAHSLVRVLGRLAQTRPVEVQRAVSTTAEADAGPGPCAHVAGAALVTGEDFASASATPQPQAAAALSGSPSPAVMPAIAIQLPGGTHSEIAAAAAAAASAAVAPGADAAAAASAAAVATSTPTSPWPSQAEPLVPDKAWTASSSRPSHSRSPQAAPATAAWPSGGGSAPWAPAGAWGS